MAARIPPDGRILFFGRDRPAFSFLSHFHPAPFQLDGLAWPTAEHYYQAQKSLDPAYRRAVRACATPGQAKRCAASGGSGWRAQRSWFVQTGRQPRPDWAAVKLDVMRRADAAKFEQNPALAALLLDTGGAEIVEDSPGDAFWGIGRDGKGENWAGRILVEVRAVLGTVRRPA